MKTCNACGKGLATPLEEFGPIQAPVCASCWYRHGEKVERYVKRDDRQMSLAAFLGQEVDGVPKGN